jgi:Fe-S oxidoreductase
MQQSGLNVPSNQVTPPVGDLSSVIHQCYQCGKCSAGCPVSPEMDLLPHQLVRLAVLGNMDRIVKSKSIWLCLTCHTCGEVLNRIDVPALLIWSATRCSEYIAGGDLPAFHTRFSRPSRPSAGFTSCFSLVCTR